MISSRKMPAFVVRLRTAIQQNHLPRLHRVLNFSQLDPRKNRIVLGVRSRNRLENRLAIGAFQREGCLLLPLDEGSIQRHSNQTSEENDINVNANDFDYT